jgi:hypothetical protein
MTRKLAGAWLLAVLAGCSQSSPTGGTAANPTGAAAVASQPSTDNDVGGTSDVKLTQVVLNVPEMT